MSNNDNSHKSATLKQLIIVISATILAITLLISVITKLGDDKPSSAAAMAEVAKPVVNNNIRPVAVVEVAAVESGPHVDKSGEDVYKAVCTMCHAAGLMNAPKLGDKSLWAPRVAQGYDKLVSNAIHGIRTMPPKGGNAALTDGEVAGAVKYMANASGASFK